MIRQRHRPLPEDLARAKAELHRNPTITTYGWRHGMECNRRPVNQNLWTILGFAEIARAMLRAKPDIERRLSQAFVPLRVDVEALQSALRGALWPLPGGRRPSPGRVPPGRPRRWLSVAPSPSPAPRHPDLDRFDQALADYEAQEDL